MKSFSNYLIESRTLSGSFHQLFLDFLKATAQSKNTFNIHEVKPILGKQYLVSMEAMSINGPISFLIDTKNERVYSKKTKQSGKEETRVWLKKTRLWRNLKTGEILPMSLKEFRELIAESPKEYRYYISTGAGNAQYTLRYRYDEIVDQKGRKVERDYHIRNLGRDPDVAKAKAREYVEILKKKSPRTRHKLNDKIGQSHLYDYLRGEEILRFGKYNKHGIEGIIKADPDYLVYIYAKQPQLFNDYQQQLLLKKLGKPIKKKQDEIEKANKENEKQMLQVQKEKENRIKRMAEIKNGDKLSIRGKVVSVKGHDYYPDTYKYMIEPENKPFMVWFQTAKKEFDKISRGAIIEVEIIVSGQGSDELVFGKSPKLIKHEQETASKASERI